MPMEMEAINVERRMSGSAIIDDLLDRIEERLAPHLRVKARGVDYLVNEPFANVGVHHVSRR